MTVFDLIFILAFLTSVGCLLSAAILAVRGRGARAARILTLWATGAGIYFTALVAVSFASPQRVLQMGEVRCWDDWCLSVETVQRTEENGSAKYRVGLRVSSRAGRRDQRGYTTVYLTDERGRRYDPLPDATGIPLSALVHPGESFATARIFSLPADARQVGLIANHGTGPGNLIIGDEASFFHKRTKVRFP